MWIPITRIKFDQIRPGMLLALDGPSSGKGTRVILGTYVRSGTEMVRVLGNSGLSLTWKLNVCRNDYVSVPLCPKETT